MSFGAPLWIVTRNNAKIVAGAGASTPGKKRGKTSGRKPSWNQSVRCRGMTAAGGPCRRRVTPPARVCGQCKDVRESRNKVSGDQTIADGHTIARNDPMAESLRQQNAAGDTGS